MKLSVIEKLTQIAFVGIILLLCTMPFFALSSYIQPQYDDFSVWAVLDKFNFFEAQVSWYTSWTGRYTAHALMSIFHPIVYRNVEMMGLVAVVIQIAFLSSSYFFLSRVMPKDTSVLKKAILFCSFLVLFYWQLPSPAEAFYWIPATFSYQLGLMLNILFFAIFWTEDINSNPKSKILLSILAALIPGTCEIALLIFLSILFATLFLRLINRKKISRTELIISALALGFSLFSLFSPGNTNRSSVMHEITGAQPGNIVFTIKSALLIIKGQLLPLLLKSPFLIVSMVFLWIVSGLNFKNETNIKPIAILGYLFAWLGLYFILHLPFIYKAGILYMPGRVLNLTQFIFIAGWLGFLSICIAFFKVKRAESPFLGLSFFGITVMYIGLQLILPNKIQSAFRDWMSGNAAAYEQAMEERFNLFEASENKDLVVAPIKNIPYTIFIADLTSNPEEDRNRLVSNYFKLKSVRADSSLLIP